MHSSEAQQPPPHRLVTRVIALSVVVILALLAWQVAEVLLLLFSAALVALLLSALALPLRRHAGLGHGVSVVVVLVLLMLALTGLGWAMGPQISSQISQLQERLPEALQRIQAWLESYSWSKSLLQSAPPVADWLPAPGKILGRISGVFSTAFGAILYLLLVMIMGVYLAIDPNLYCRGILLLVPKSAQEQAGELLETLGRALRWWLVGQLLAMLAVGVLTAFGLWLIDLPMFLALGLIAGLLAFVPYLGPMASAVPAILVAFVDDPIHVVYVIGVFASVQFLEGNFLTPMIQRSVVYLAPALLLSAQLLMAILFGFLGVLLATPLTVAVLVVVQVLYVRDFLDHPVRVLGQHD
jgi:predicted PurR-regulated permease PerM